MQMKHKQIVLAVAAVLAVTSAFAVFDPVDVPSATKIVLSGATAADDFIQSAATGMLKGGYKSYRNKHLTQAFWYRAWFGVAKAGILGVPENTLILIVKRSTGGSMWGVEPVARASRIQSMDFTSCVPGGTVVIGGQTEGTYDYFCDVKGRDPSSFDFANPGVNNGDVSDLGVSAVSPVLFKGPYNMEFYNAEFGQTQLGAAELAALSIKPVNTLMMGVVATNDVPVTTRITRTDYANMLAGNVYDWTQIDPSLSGNTQVVVCRRVNGSGTQASYNWFFNNFPCQNGFAGVMAPASMVQDSASGIVGGDGSFDTPFLIDPTQGYTVVNNYTSGDVRNCLIKAQRHADHMIFGDDYTKWYKIRFGNSTSPFKAIGVLSLDSYNPNGSSVSNGEGIDWRFRMMDGAGTYVPGTNTVSAGATGTAPSKANLLSGAYDFAVELTMQYRNQTVVNPQGDTIAALTGVKKAIANELINRSGDPAKIAGNSKAKAYAALPDIYNPNTNLTNLAHVALGSHGGNMCSPLKRRY